LEKKVDRARSSTVAKLEKHDTGTAAIDASSTAQPTKAAAKQEDESSSAANGAAGSSEDVKMGEPDEQANKVATTKEKEDENDRQEGSSGLSRSEIQELQMLAEMRAKEVEELQSQKVTLQTELDRERRNVSQEYTTNIAKGRDIFD
jgi:hypothetical protein